MQSPGVSCHRNEEYQQENGYPDDASDVEQPEGSQVSQSDHRMIEKLKSTDDQQDAAWAVS